MTLSIARWITSSSLSRSWTNVLLLCEMWLTIGVSRVGVARQRVTGRNVTLKFVQGSQDIIKHFLIVMGRKLVSFLRL